MGLENVRLRLASDAEVAEVFRCPAQACAAVEAEVAEVAEVLGDRVASVLNRDMQRLQRSCRGFSKTYAPAKSYESNTSEGRAEVAEVFHSLTHAQARAGEEKSGREPLQPVQPLRAPGQATILRHCRCIDCRHWIRPPYSECVHGLIRNGVKPVPEYPADAWHYCALYHGPQLSKDVIVWPKATPRAAQVGAGSNISADTADPTPVNKKRDVTKRRANGSFPATYKRRRRREQSRASSLFVAGANIT